MSHTALRALRSKALSNATRNGLRTFTTLPPYPPTHNATPARPPQGAMPMPFVTETVGGGWHTYDIFSRLLKERIICLNGEVDETMSASIVAQLLFLEADAPQKSISLYINSPGGIVTAGLAIYDTMTYIRSPVSTICIGQAASMGSLLLCGGQAGERDSEVRQQLNEIYMRHLTKKHTLEEIEKYMERDYFMGAKEALEFGIVDKILDRRESDQRD
ncbi:hypothetical protein H2203_005632 [Taxawa tesnikishii (nom. ined.)]|nr:hypothetical protein H2203_005632 [Dothideales sp. JES 119]